MFDNTPAGISRAYARLRNTRRPVAGASPPAGAVAFLVSEAELIFDAADGI
ncbi:hypothetical protein EYZ11_005728 [Aspergillus tanneri]|uniref:Uncharacterized protein n=1 Tax=Aspergillus tanneri TaxID=1220188 RepID=A0A4S3JHH7_9EURO|nr:hypothetical protein EYZ11_005728 [Aspergillus tanneri]